MILTAGMDVEHPFRRGPDPRYNPTGSGSRATCADTHSHTHRKRMEVQGHGRTLSTTYLTSRGYLVRSMRGSTPMSACQELLRRTTDRDLAWQHHAEHRKFSD